MPTVLLGIGLPGSGKTSVLKRLADQLGYCYIDVDLIRKELKIDVSELLDGSPRVLILQARVRECVKEALTKELDVVVDDYNANHIERQILISFCRRNGARKIRGIWFVPPREICLSRNDRRTNPADIVPEDIIMALDAQILAHPPQKEEGFDVLDVINPLRRKPKPRVGK